MGEDVEQRASSRAGSPMADELMRRQQRQVFALAAVLLAAMLAAAAMYPRLIGRSLDVPNGGAHLVCRTIDPNTAAWYELAQLPGLGETVARRVVEFREAREAVFQPPERDPPVFNRPADLLHVKGIGEKTLLRIGPFLSFPAAAADDQEPAAPPH